MTLGRTSSNAIKIKTDGGTTRAVNCACCGGCRPCQVDISQNESFLQTLQNATAVSISLTSEEYSDYLFTPLPNGFDARFDNYAGAIIAEIVFDKICKQVFIYIDVGGDNYATSFTYESCPYSPSFDFAGMTYNQEIGADCYVNGVRFPMLRTYIFSNYPPPIPPSINFTVF
jgi:hypothetical protein